MDKLRVLSLFAGIGILRFRHVTNVRCIRAVEPDVGRVANGIPKRVDRLRCLGNAVVPQIPELIGRAILQAIDHPSYNLADSNAAAITKTGADP